MSATNSAISTLTENNVETSSKQGKCVTSTDIIDLYIVPTELLSNGEGREGGGGGIDCGGAAMSRIL